jgi:uncharacterized protein
MKQESVLITGGSGLVGRYLTSLLLSEGYKVSHLSRNHNENGKVSVFTWDPGKQIIDPAAFIGVDYLIHLAGANIGEKRWTAARKKEIVSSRVESAGLLHKTVAGNKFPLKAFISASATGYYGSVTSGKIFTEEDSPGKDFLGNTCRLWEEGADLFQASDIRTVKIRSGVVLEKSDSALTKMMKPARFGFLVQTGSGRQYMPWVHISDLCSIYLKAIKDQNLSGAYNAVSPQHLTHKEFLKTLALIMQKPVFPLPVPAFILYTVLGEMSDVILKGSRVSSQKIISAGHSFLFPEIKMALENILPFSISH